MTKVALITGSARRIGASIARHLHQQGMNVVLHYRSAITEVHELAEQLNVLRPDSAITVVADLLDMTQLSQLVQSAAAKWQRLDVLINNASSFYPTSVGVTSEQQWDDLMGSNLKAPYFLVQAALPWLSQQQGCVVNITDVNAQQPIKNYPVYCAAKAGLWMLTQALAQELAPAIRVNAVAPGTIIWPEGTNVHNAAQKQAKLQQIPLRRLGEPLDIAKAVWYLINDGDYITGQVIKVDGGKSIKGYFD